MHIAKSHPGKTGHIHNTHKDFIGKKTSLPLCYLQYSFYELCTKINVADTGIYQNLSIYLLFNMPNNICECLWCHDEEKCQDVYRHWSVNVVLCVWLGILYSGKDGISDSACVCSSRKGTVRQLYRHTPCWHADTDNQSLVWVLKVRTWTTAGLEAIAVL